jgi:uncharacterized protein YjbI with pentapeptide repeats
MNSGSGLSIKKPVAQWNKLKPIQADFKELFKSMGKATVDGALGKWEELAKDVIEASAALGLAETPEEVAWVLIYRSLVQAMLSLMKENFLFLEPKKKNLNDFCDRQLNLSLETRELSIDQKFFQNPKTLPILEDIKTPFTQFLVEFGIIATKAETISQRLPTYFVFALHEEWAEHSDKYACLKDELDTPFTKANEREHLWLRYLTWLQKEVEKPLFSVEPFGLKQVYVPLRAYYQRKIEPKKDEEFERRITEDKQYQRVVVDLEEELENWLNKAERDDAIRVISGGPGSGKSSFTKIFAAKQSAKGEIRVLFIPLHQFNPLDDLVDALDKFIKVDIENILPSNPLLRDNLESRLLIIFDGLDELEMQGRVAAEVAQQFVREVQKKIGDFNRETTRLQVLMSGRELSVQANSSDFRKPRQVLHILPYFLKDEERKNFVEEEKAENNNTHQALLEEDQRHFWWQQYGTASGYGYESLPEELDTQNLTDITAQPLLNYLVALSFVRGEVKFSEDSNLNTIYEDLLKAVYGRVWSDNKHHPVTQEFEIQDEEQFARILEEIALACWHGDGRTTTVKKIEEKCGNNKHLKKVFEKYQQAAEAGVTRLLTAFYFRQSGYINEQKTFEFTHKSFREYLTARRIVREVRLIHKKLEEHQNDSDDGWDEREALEKWIILCGSSAMDQYLFKFILDEMRLQDKAEVGKWQQTLYHLIGFMLRKGMPMKRLDPRPDFQEENRLARNAEEALLAVLNACARVTESISKIEWHSPEAFGTWISRLYGQRVNYNDQVFCLRRLSFLDLQNCILIHKDFYKAVLRGAVLRGADLKEAVLRDAVLRGADLREADLRDADLREADLREAVLSGAVLSGADLRGAVLRGAVLRGADLREADLSGADLRDAVLSGAVLRDAVLSGAVLRDAVLREADLRDADLRDANLRGADLKNIKHEGAKIAGTILEGKDLTLYEDDQDSHSDES